MLEVGPVFSGNLVPDIVVPTGHRVHAPAGSMLALGSLDVQGQTSRTPVRARHRCAPCWTLHRAPHVPSSRPCPSAAVLRARPVISRSGSSAKSDHLIRLARWAKGRPPSGRRDHRPTRRGSGSSPPRSTCSPSCRSTGPTTGDRGAGRRHPAVAQLPLQLEGRAVAGRGRRAVRRARARRWTAAPTGLRGVDELTVGEAADPRVHLLLGARTRSCIGSSPRSARPTARAWTGWSSATSDPVRADRRRCSRAWSRPGHVPDIPVAHLYYILTGAGPTMFVLAPECRRLSGIDPRSARWSKRTPTPSSRSSSAADRRSPDAAPDSSSPTSASRSPTRRRSRRSSARSSASSPASPRPTGTVTWRNDDRAQRRRSSSPVRPTTPSSSASRPSTTPRSTPLVARLDAAGFDVDRRHRRRARAIGGVERLARTMAPVGRRGRARRRARRTPPRRSRRRSMPGGFLTDGVGFGHVVFATTAFDESHRVRSSTGSAWRSRTGSRWRSPPGIELEVRFYHCNDAPPHRSRWPRRRSSCRRSCTTSCSRRTSRDDVGAAFDRAWATRPRRSRTGSGRHDNDGMFSFYVASPAGFQVEVGHGARVITDDWDDNRRYDRISAWGHQPLRQP